MFNGIHSKSISSDRAGNRLKHLDDEIIGESDTENDYGSEEDKDDEDRDDGMKVRKMRKTIMTKTKTNTKTKTKKVKMRKARRTRTMNDTIFLRMEFHSSKNA